MNLFELTPIEGTYFLNFFRIATPLYWNVAHGKFGGALEKFNLKNLISKLYTTKGAS